MYIVKTSDIKDAVHEVRRNPRSRTVAKVAAFAVRDAIWTKVIASENRDKLTINPDILDHICNQVVEDILGQSV